MHRLPGPAYFGEAIYKHYTYKQNFWKTEMWRATFTEATAKETTIFLVQENSETMKDPMMNDNVKTGRKNGEKLFSTDPALIACIRSSFVLFVAPPMGATWQCESASDLLFFQKIQLNSQLQLMFTVEHKYNKAFIVHCSLK